MHGDTTQNSRPESSLACHYECTGTGRKGSPGVDTVVCVVSRHVSAQLNHPRLLDTVSDRRPFLSCFSFSLPCSDPAPLELDISFFLHNHPAISCRRVRLDPAPCPQTTLTIPTPRNLTTPCLIRAAVFLIYTTTRAAYFDFDSPSLILIVDVVARTACLLLVHSRVEAPRIALPSNARPQSNLRSALLASNDTNHQPELTSSTQHSCSSLPTIIPVTATRTGRPFSQSAPVAACPVTLRPPPAGSQQPAPTPLGRLTDTCISFPRRLPDKHVTRRACSASGVGLKAQTSRSV